MNGSVRKYTRILTVMPRGEREMLLGKPSESLEQASEEAAHS